MLTLESGSVDLLATRHLFEQALALLKRSHRPKLLLDLRLIARYEPLLLAWLLLDWGPRAITSGYLRQVAVLPSAVPVGRLQATQLFLEAQRRYGLVSRFFCTQPPATALEWLA